MNLLVYVVGLTVLSKDVESFFGFPLITEPKYLWRELLVPTSVLVVNHPLEYPGEECDRPCDPNEPPRICYYHWIMESYTAMGSSCWDCIRGNRAHCFHAQCVTGSGRERGIVSINRKVPGPPIVVCRNDTIVVDVSNEMDGLATAIHWHGFHQLDSPWMDGVPMVTQCPIPAGTSFRYRFQAVDPGTQWYHSHSGYQKANGHLGVAVVRNPHDVNINLYDYDLTEHAMLLSDWSEHTVENWIPGQQSSALKVDSILINGRGRHYNNYTKKWATAVPLAVFRVQPNKRYRFRMISGGSQYCPFKMQIEKHRMEIISTDGGAVQPQMVDTLISLSGERYDFVLTANQPPGNYWIRVRGIAFCNKNPVEGFAVLSYADPSVSTESLSYPEEDPPEYEHEYPEGIILNRHTDSCYRGKDENICTSKLESHEVHRDSALIDAVPDKQFYWGFTIVEADNSWLFSNEGFVRFTTVRDAFNVFGVTNNISLVPPSFPLLTQPEQITDVQQQFCNETNLPPKCANRTHCFCTHLLKVDLNDIVEIVLYDTAPYAQDFYHPFHIHGHRFIVTDMGRLPQLGLHERLQRLKQRKHARKPGTDYNPPYKDTVSIPNQGFVRTRFRANNPGFWLVHCHFEWHLATGMGLVLQVGEVDQMPKPPADFPRCGNFKPNVLE
ncbi:hypothetical protein pipiens_010547 [Culex pipiens pipiens]|uniref:Multicopper oxidase n=1 Tax=Culex pipiens pipiens TaxID=38569 RepID=A0ABD1D9R1_CULPP